MVNMLVTNGSHQGQERIRMATRVRACNYVLELHALTLIARSYALLLGCILFYV